MFNRLSTYIANESLFEQSDRLLLAVSGGVDSMVMLHLFQQLPYEFTVLHCNFNLRAEESDEEESFLRDYCARFQLKLEVKHFDTKAFASQQGISIEMAARELRYAWFEDMKNQTQSNYILTAHHKDDLVETILINLSRGTGIKGLVGIQSKLGDIVRPLLFASRADILTFAHQFDLAYRHDSSNDELIYQRNVIRHQIIPLFESLNPAFRNNVVRTAANLHATASLYFDEVKQCEKDLIQDGRLSISKLLVIPHASTILFEILSNYGFNATQSTAVFRSLSGNSGKIFTSKSYRIIKDRDELIISELQIGVEETSIPISENQQLKEPVSLQLETECRLPGFSYSLDANVAELDFDKLTFPLELRKWKNGDVFMPLGMKGRKKISDFFTDEKMSILEKEQQWILCSAGEIVWVVGRRVDDRFKITKATRHICRIKRT